MQSEYIQIIQDSTNRLLSVTEQLVDLARIEAGRLELLIGPVDLPDMLRNVAAAYEARLKAKGHRLALSGPAELPPALCDGPRFAQILGILLGNAVNSTPDGRTITLSFQCAADRGYVQIGVSNTGIGFAPEEHARLLEPFLQSCGKPKSGLTAVGLGLHLAQALVNIQGGRMWIESQLGQGAPST